MGLRWHKVVLGGVMVSTLLGCPTSPEDDTSSSSGGGGGGGSSSGTVQSSNGGSSAAGGSSGNVGSSGGSAMDSSGMGSSGAAGSTSSASVGSSGGGSSSGTPCALDVPGAEDRDRVVLLSHTFGPMAGEPGTWVRSLTLPVTGALVDDGVRVDVGVKVRRIMFLPSGTLALALGEDGDLISLAVDAVDLIHEVDRVTLPSADFTDVILGENRRVYVVGLNVAETSGLSTVAVECDGQLTVDTAAFFNIRLAESLALLPDKRAVLLGGQASFAPVDVHDTRILTVGTAGFTELAALDLWSDVVNTGRIGASPSGDLIVVPNNSIFSAEGGKTRVFKLVGNTMTQTQQLDLASPQEVLWSPDGETVLISRDEANRVAVYRRTGDTLTFATEITGMGLATQFGMVTRGMAAGRILVPSVDPNGGPNVAMLRLTGVGMVANEGQVELGAGSEHIPDAVAIQP